MSTVEKLFVQIFERKNWIIEQVKQQTDLYEQHLASKLLIEGIRPPPWLFNSGFHTETSDLKELKKEELISELLLQCPRPAIPCSSGLCSMYNKPVVTVSNGEFSDHFFTETHASNKDSVARYGPTVVPQCLNNDTGDASNGVPELDPIAASPQDLTDAKISDTYPEPDQSLARIQRSKLRQKALELRNSAKAVTKSRLGDENNTGFYSSGAAGSRIASLQPDHVSEFSELVNRFNITNESCGVKEAKIGDCRSKEKGSSVYSGRITRSRSSCQQTSGVNESLKLDSSSDIAKEDGGTLAQSIGKSMQQPDHVDELLELVNPSGITNESCVVREAEIQDCWSKEKGSSVYSGRITRSRSSCQQTSGVNESSKLDSSSDIAKEDGGTLAQSIGKSMQQPDHVDELLELVNPSGITDESCVVREAEIWDFPSKEKDKNIYFGRITRSRSSCQQPNGVSKSLKLDSSSYIDKEDGGTLSQCIGESMQPLQHFSWIRGEADFQNAQGTQMTAGRSLPSQKDLELCAGNAREHPSKGNVTDEYVGGNTRSRSTCSIEGIPKPVNSSNISGCELTRSRFAGSKKSPRANSLNRFEGFDIQKASGTQVNVSPCTDTDDNVNQERCVRKFSETEPVSDGPVEARSGSNFDGASLRVWLEVLVSRPPSDCSMFVEPRQLDFDDVGERNLNETFSPVLERERSLEKGCFTLLEPVGSLDKVASINPEENFDSSLEKLSLEEQEVLKKEREAQRGPSGAHAEQGVEVEKEYFGFHALSSSRTSNLSAVSSVKETSEVYEDAVTHRLLESDKILEHTSPLIDNSTTVRVSRNNSLGRPLKKAADFNLCNGDAETGIDFYSEKGIGELDMVKPAKLISEDSKLETDACNGPKRSANPDIMKVTGSSLLSDPSLGIELSYAVSLDGTEGNSAGQKMKSDIARLQDTEQVTPYLLGNGISEDKNTGCSKSGKLQIAKDSMPPERNFSPAVEGSLPQYKRRKIEGQLTNVFSSSPSLRVKPLQSSHGDTISRYLKNVEDNSNAVLKFQHFPVSDAAQSNVNKSPDVEVKCHTIEGFEPSPELRVEEGELGFKGRDKSANTHSTFKHKQIGPSLVSSLTKQGTGDLQGCLVEEVGTADPTSIILDVRRQCAAEDNQDLLRLENKFDLGNADDLACTERNLQESKSLLREDGLLSYCSVGSPHNEYLDLIGADQTMPVFEGFIIDAQTENGQPHIAGDEISFDTLDLPNTTIERASVLEQLCKSASIHTPLSHFSATYKLHRAPDLYQSVPNGLLEQMDPRSTLPLNDDGGKWLRASYSGTNEEVNCAFQGMSYSDCLPCSGARFGWNIKKPYTSPVGKLWERIKSNSSDSEKQGSLNPELTCFPIEEDPSISEENRNTDEVVDTFQDGIGSVAMNSFPIREPLIDITEEYPKPPASVSAAEIFPDRSSLDSVNTEINFTGTHNRVKRKLGNHNSSRRRCTNEEKENLGGNGVKKTIESLHNRFSKPKLSGKTSLRKGGPSLSQKDSKRNNIVSNINSFIPLVQQKQAAAVVTGKRDIKVKALEAAEAAKRLEVKRENERKMKKEALKLERARLEQEDLRQLELKKKKKEEEQKKKDAAVAARKRLREEEETKEKERKRKRIEEARRQQREHEEKLRAEKEEKEIRCRARDEKVDNAKEFNSETGRHQKMEKESGEDKFGKKLEIEPRAAEVSMSDTRKASIVIENCEAFSDCRDIGKVMSISDKATENDNLVTKTSREQSYEISPYQCSDDEEEEEDDIPNRKYIPSWASKNCLAVVISSQQKVDPDVIFPPGSFCSMAEATAERGGNVNGNGGLQPYLQFMDLTLFINWDELLHRQKISKNILGGDFWEAGLEFYMRR